MTKTQLMSICEQIAELELMVKHDLTSREVKILLEYPDIRLGTKIKEYQTSPY